MRGAHEPVARLRSFLLCCLLGIGALVGVTPAASAEPAGSVSGTVRAGGAPVANAWVTLMPVTTSGDWSGRPQQATTDRDGRYAFVGLDAVHVKIQVRAPSLSGLASTYWPDAYSFASARTLRVAPSGSTADVDLADGGSISGRVVDAGTGAPITGAQVVAHVDAAPGWESVGSAGLASGPGQFTIDGLPPVPVALQVRAGQGSNHLAQWYDGAGFQGEADRVLPGTAGLVIRLREGGQVSGSVRTDEGAGVPGASVTLVGCPALCPMVALADDSGAYRVNGVPPGPGLRAYAQAPDVGLLSRWYSAPGQTGDTSFDLGQGQVLSGVDFALTQGVLVVGRILDAQTGQPIRGVSVDLEEVGNRLHSYLSREVEEPVGQAPAPVAGANDPLVTASPTGSDLTAPERASGLVIGPVPPGEYSVVLYPGSENADYLPVEIVDSSGLDGQGRLQLTRGGRVEFVVSLARQRTSVPGGAAVVRSGVSEPVGRPGPGASAGWPGLYSGFLSADDLGLVGLRA